MKCFTVSRMSPAKNDDRMISAKKDTIPFYGEIVLEMEDGSENRRRK